MDISVEVQNLTKRFDRFTAVDSINFSVRKGEIFGFLGPNGAGKSTTIKMLCGILSPTGGTGTVSGYDIIEEQDKIKNTIGYMSQKFSLYHDLTVRENLEFFGSIYGLSGSRLKDRIHYVKEMAGIGERMDSKVDILPGGIKQRLALGGAILHDPPVLFLDEPTSGVDPLMRRNFWELIYEFSREGKTIFVTTHYMDEAEHCNRMALVIAGRIIALDTPDNLKQSLPYSVYSLKTDDFIATFEKISKLDFIEEAAIFGSDIHILCEKKFNLKKELGKALLQMGITVFRIDRIHATLEDVFVTHARKLGVLSSMAYHFLNIETSEYYYCDEQEWSDALEIAKKDYWEPDGTIYDPLYEAADQSFDSDDLMYFYFMLISVKNEADYWDGSYLTKGNQIVLYEDAYYLAKSLDGTGVSTELIEFVRKGSFRICSE